jgi:hypothetical protein
MGLVGRDESGLALEEEMREAEPEEVLDDAAIERPPGV